jgi:4-diphosphocytidyl-2-C-methyl-D-erythritol kinase
MKRLAPAKINLSLRILGRRKDGFHEIETLMAPLTLADEIGAELAGDGITLACSDPSLPVGPANLAYRAAQLFLDRFGAPDAGVRLTLEKHVPHGAGLGGGSSDAATVLLALNEMLGVHAPLADLSELASALGSDVPFFLHGGPAICRGRGERVEPVKLDVSLPLLLLKPPFPIPTPWAYSRWRDAREIPGVLYAPQKFPWGVLVNDLERPVFEKYLPLAHLKMWLLDQPEVAGALLSGSGSTILAVLHEPALAGPALAERARSHFGELWTAVCRTFLLTVITLGVINSR